MKHQISQPRGSYRVIRVDGTETIIEHAPTLREVYREIGCECVDTVVLATKGGRATVVMMVDDVGIIDGKPVNYKATEMRNLYRGLSPYAIHGDVAIVTDRDFS